MKNNTKLITNITDFDFIGRFGGVDIVLEAKQTRFLPSHISQHIAEQLVAIILEQKKKRNPKIDIFEEKPRLLSQILGEEIKTEEPTNLSLKEEIEKHERDFAKLSEDTEKLRIIKKEEILKENV